jgi:Holliday junction resolvase RusA-like endonuclease
MRRRSSDSSSGFLPVLRWQQAATETRARGGIMAKINFFVPGIPAPGGSKRGFYIKKIKRVVMAPDCARTRSWMDSVACFAKAAYSKLLLTGPLRLEIEFRILRPQGHYGTGKNAGTLKDSAPKYPIVKPDGVKLTRSTEDAMKGIVWRDDSQVVEHCIRKVYVGRDPGAEITINQIF